MEQKVSELLKKYTWLKEPYEKIDSIRTYVDAHSSEESEQFLSGLTSFVIKENIALGVTCYNMLTEKLINNPPSSDS